MQMSTVLKLYFSGSNKHYNTLLVCLYIYTYTYMRENKYGNLATITVAVTTRVLLRLKFQVVNGDETFWGQKFGTEELYCKKMVY